jgi:hypothetical protein
MAVEVEDASFVMRRCHNGSVSAMLPQASETVDDNNEEPSKDATKIRAFSGLHDFTLSLNDLVVSNEKLGQGAFGTVREGCFRNRLCAIKFLRLPTQVKQ